jgi:hypothetical protein
MLTSVALVVGFTISAPTDDELQKAVAALIDVFRHPEARSTRLEESRRAIAALAAIGKPAVPKLLDAILAKDDPATAYSSLALKGMPAQEAEEVIAARWEKAGTADRWKLVPFYEPLAFGTVARFALDCFEGKGNDARSHAWGFVIRNAKSKAVAPAKDRYLKALAGDEEPAIRWGLLAREPVFDDGKEADILIELLKPDSWAAKGEGRLPPLGHTPPGWPDGRNFVADVLAHRQVKRAVPALVALLAEKGEGKAYFGDTVVPILGDLGDKAAGAELKRVLNAKPEDYVPNLASAKHLKALAARALWQLGDLSGRPLLKEDLKHKGWNERRYATETIARFGTKEDIPLLASVLDDEDWGVLQAASEGLERITGVKNRPNNNTRASDADAPLWKEWLKKNPQPTSPR